MVGLFTALESAGINPETGEIINETVISFDDFNASRDELEEHIVHAAVCEDMVNSLTDAYDAIDGMGATPCIESLNLIKDVARNTLLHVGLSISISKKLIPSIESFAVGNVLVTMGDALKRAIQSLIEYLIELGTRLKNFVMKQVNKFRNIEKEIQKTEEKIKEAVSKGNNVATLPVSEKQLTQLPLFEQVILNTPPTLYVDELNKLREALPSLFSAMKDNQKNIQNNVTRMHKGELAEELKLSIFFQDALGDTSLVKHGRLPTSESIMGVIPNLPFGHEFVYNIPSNNNPKLSDLPHYDVRIRINAGYKQNMESIFNKKDYSDIKLPASELIQTVEALKKLNTALKFDTISPDKITTDILNLTRSIKTNDFDRRNNLNLQVMRAAARFLTTEYFVWSDYYTSITISMNELLNKVTWE